MGQVTRRGFLQFAAGSGAAAAVEFGAKTYERLIPYVVGPDDSRPQQRIVYTTTCRECPAGCGMRVFHVDGRAIKAEGNPEHPVSGGGLCPRGQASLQGLYDPDRLRRPLQWLGPTRAPAGFEPRSWQAAIAGATQQLGQARDKGRVIVISDLHTGAMAEVLAAFAKALGADAPVYYEPFSYDSLRQAHRELMGKPIIPRYDLSKAGAVVSFGADFLETWVSNVEFTRQFTLMRAPGAASPKPFVYAGPRLSMTATNADLALQVQPSRLKWAALALLDTVCKLPAAASVNYGPLLSRVRAMGGEHAAARCGLAEAQLRRLLAIQQRPGAMLATAGTPIGYSDADRDTCLAAAMLNALAAMNPDSAPVNFAVTHALGNVARQDDLAKLLESLTPRDAMVIVNANIAYAMPAAAEHLRRAGAIVYLGTMLDETAELARWVLPVHSPLEAWGDYEPWTRTHCIQQPTMSPVFDTRHAGDLLIELAAAMGKPISRPGRAAPRRGAQAIPGAPWGNCPKACGWGGKKKASLPMR